MKDLKPCPFCGGEMYVVSSSKARRFTVYHKDPRSCHFYSFEIDWQTAGSLKEAREAWNRRSYEQVEPKTGRWIEKTVKEGSPFFWRRFYCTACGDWTTHGKSNFCPNCGARMEREHEVD